MRGRIILAMLLATACTAQAKDHDYQKGTLTSMDTSSCGVKEKGNKTVAGEILGTDAQHKTTQELLCQEYVLQTEKVTYRLRPRDDKHPVLLPIGETAEFRIDKDKLILRVPEMDGKEREFIVLSMTPRPAATDSKTNTAASH
jgi:hypothetical protein